jgi:tetratricopeptide (TPR) repeat protein
MEPRIHARCALVALVLCGSSPALLADRVVTRDGRILTPKKARAEGTGYRFVFEHGEILLEDGAQVQSVEIEGDMSDYVPQNDDERRKLADGYVRYRGRWLSKPAYEAELRQEFEESKARTDLLTAHSSMHDPWTQETKHFLFRSNTSPEIVEHYAELLEAYYDLMDKRIGIKPTPTYRKLKMTVNVYRSHENFYKLSGAPSPSVLGFFNPSDNTLNFFHDYAEPARSEWVALHECTHLLTFLIDQQYNPQIWLNEAVADYFGSSDVTTDKRGRVEIEPGKLQTDRVLTVQQAIEQKKDIQLADLFFIDRDHFRGFEYAHAWSFVYFLNNYDGGKYAKGFAKFFRGLYTLEKGVEYETELGPPPSGVWKTVKPETIRDLLLKRIGVKDVGELEEQWKTFIREIPVDAPLARLKRGMRSVYEFDFKEALEDLDAAIEGGVEDPRAWALRGRALAFTGERERAIADLETAVAKDPLNAAYRYELAKVRIGELTVGNVVPGTDVTVEMTRKDNESLDDAEAKRQAGLAVDLAPDNDRYQKLLERFP